jgi:hypothetical protein
MQVRDVLKRGEAERAFSYMHLELKCLYGLIRGASSPEYGLFVGQLEATCRDSNIQLGAISRSALKSTS